MKGENDMTDYEQEIMESLEIVKQSGICNMFDIPCVQNQLADQESLYLTAEEVKKFIMKYME